MPRYGFDMKKKKKKIKENTRVHTRWKPKRYISLVTGLLDLSIKRSRPFPNGLKTD